MADTDSTSPDKKRQEPPPIEFLKPGEDQPAPQPQQRPAAAWVTRPEDYQQPQYAQPAAPPRAAAVPGNHARIAGILLILGAAISAVDFLLASLTPIPYSDYQNFTADPSVFALNQVCGLIVIWAQAIMVIGGVMAFQRMNWRMAVGMALFSMLVVGGYAVAVLSGTLDVALIGAALLSLAGFVLTVIAKPEFVS